MKRFAVFSFLVLVCSPPAFSWGPLTHYHLAKQAGGRSGFICSFCSHAMYPDAFILGDVARHWIDPAHAPNPKKEDKRFPGVDFPFANDPMFGYLMFYVSEDNLAQQDVSLGMGCHSAADWVAHAYFKIVDVELDEAKKALLDQLSREQREDFFQRLPIFLSHGTAELLGDIKSFVDFGPFIPSYQFYPELMWKAFFNYSLIRQHDLTLGQTKEQRKIEIQKVFPNTQLCQAAQNIPGFTCWEEDVIDHDETIKIMYDPTRTPNTAIGPAFIETNIRKMNLKAAAEQVIFGALILARPGEILGFLGGVELIMDYSGKFQQARNVIQNLWLDKSNRTTRGMPEPWNPLPPDSPIPKAKALVLQTEDPPATDQPGIEPETLFQEFLQKVVDKSEATGAITSQTTQGTDEYGDAFVEVTVQVVSESGIQQAFEQTVNEYITQPETYLHLRLGKWMKRLFIDKNLNAELLLDFDPPAVQILSPEDRDMVNANPLIISGTATDKNFLSYKLEFGAGENPTSFSVICDGTQAVQDGTLCSWNTQNLSGLHTLKLSAIDQNDNENETRIQVFLGNPTLQKTVGQKGNKAGEFNQPTGLAMDSDGNLYVADTMNHRIQKFNKDLAFVLSIGSKSAGKPSETAGEFNQPVGLAINENKLYVADTLNHHIQVFDLSGSFVSTFGSKSQFNQPTGLTFSGGALYLSDRLNHRIVKLDAQGNVVSSFGEKGNEPGQFHEPTGLASFTDFLYVADKMNDRISVFSLTPDPLPLTPILSGFKQPEGVFADAKGNLHIADTMNHRVLKHDRFGNLMFTVSDFKQPAGVLVSADTLYVADTLNHRIQVYQTKIPALSSLSKTESEKPEDQKPLSPGPLKLGSVKNFPNPTRNPHTKFYYKPQSGALTSAVIELFTLSGKLVVKIIDPTPADGEYLYEIPSAIANGVYLYRITLSDGATTAVRTGKLVLLR